MTPATTASPTPPVAGRGLWRTQTLTVAAQELRRGLIGLRALGLLFLCGFPIVIVTVATVIRMSGFVRQDMAPNAGRLAIEYATFYQMVMLRLVIFFVCALVFSRLFRVEIQQRSLHYYLLTPLRREVFAAGKYLAGLILTGAAIAVATAVSFLVYHYPLSMNSGSGGFGAFLAAEGFGQMLLYVGISLLGVLGYGAVFFAMGLYFKNPILPTVAVYAIEGLNPLLPVLLKQFSVIHYLQSLQPVPVSQGPLAILAEPASPFIAVPGLVAVAAVLLWLSAKKARKLEIHYGDE